MGCVFRGCWEIWVALSVLSRHQGQQSWEAGKEAHRQVPITIDPTLG